MIDLNVLKSRVLAFLRKDGVSSFSSCIKPSKSAFWYLRIRLGQVGFLIGLRLDSTKTALLSEIPGMTLVWLTRVSLLVKNSSRMLALVSVVLVGSVTI